MDKYYLNSMTRTDCGIKKLINKKSKTMALFVCIVDIEQDISFTMRSDLIKKGYKILHNHVQTDWLNATYFK